MNILFIGDLVARAGRDALHKHLGGLQTDYDADLTIVNCENAASGFGITPKIADEVFGWGIDVLTSGNHIWDRKEILPYLDAEPRIVRPANYPPQNPGRGATIVEARNGEPVAVVNIQGLAFMPSIGDPFRTVDTELAKIPEHVKVIVVDMHAEATAEKVAMGWHLDGKVSAVLGTHTHIPTADERILPQGTAYQTDVGMTGPFDSVIGMTRESVLERYYTQTPVRFEAATDGAEVHGTVIRVHPATGSARSIERITRT